MWVTSKVAKDELVKISKRRTDMYQNLLEIKAELPSKKIDISEIKNKILNKTISSSENDKTYLDKLFDSCLRKAQLPTEIDPYEYTYLLPYLKNDMGVMIFRIESLINDMDKKQIVDYSKIPKVFELYKYLKRKLPQVNSHNSDIRIICDAIGYSNNDIDTKFITGDHYHLTHYQNIISYSNEVFDKDIKKQMVIIDTSSYIYS